MDAMRFGRNNNLSTGVAFTLMSHLPQRQTPALAQWTNSEEKHFGQSTGRAKCPLAQMVSGHRPHSRPAYGGPTAGRPHSAPTRAPSEGPMTQRGKALAAALHHSFHKCGFQTGAGRGCRGGSGGASPDCRFIREGGTSGSERLPPRGPPCRLRYLAQGHLLQEAPGPASLPSFLLRLTQGLSSELRAGLATCISVPATCRVPTCPHMDGDLQGQGTSPCLYISVLCSGS